ncbi:class I SAM-dependent methyltransferase [Polynucleobacter paneuropaeus]|jgi:hypothetical protein|uniref:class I SAM-dependent methyltransferase n=1 Tax=Polynucleobacter paneuropaeus TaxID=2527775 RepID=UPI0013142860|nr:class I SAM-dependent methyltransferase [Polynucleobacter paneuropaeus]
MKNPIPAEVEIQLEQLEIYKAYKKSPHLSVKHSNYFHVYESLLLQYRNKPITFVEIGILGGGSLFMWREFFGKEARIIGIDLNPEAKKWEKEGFEIFIGSQSDPNFWHDFYNKVGSVDIVLDDGGHTNEQQVVTSACCIPHIKDDGLMIVEDVHTSYMKRFGNPSPYSFINYGKNIIDKIFSRSSEIPDLTGELKKYIFSIEFFVSIVCFKINRKKCYTSTFTRNIEVETDFEDFWAYDRYRFSDKVNDGLAKLFAKIGIKFSARKFLRLIENHQTNKRIKNYFDN